MKKGSKRSKGMEKKELEIKSNENEEKVEIKKRKEKNILKIKNCIGKGGMDDVQNLRGFKKDFMERKLKESMKMKKIDKV